MTKALNNTTICTQFFCTERRRNTIKDENLHSGHRERLRKRAVADPDLETFSEHEILELLLFYTIPRADTNAIAHRLILKFGNIRGVFEASRQELETVEGIGPNSAFFLALFPSVTRKYLLSRAVTSVHLTSSAHLGEALMPYFIGRKEEVLYALFLDKNKRTISCDYVGQGSPNSVTFNSEKLIQLATFRNASFAVVAHNHTSGFATPSEQDYLSTQRIKLLLDSVGVKLLDHLIISDPLGDTDDICEFVSLADSGLFTPE